MASSFSYRRTLMIGLAALALPALAHAATAAASFKGDPAKGEVLFKARCSACHTVVDDGATHPAPLLRGVVGRKAASWDSFKGYSPALKASCKTWDRASLDQFLTLPGKYVP